MYVSTSVKFNINILKWKENYSMHISQDHHLDKQVLQFWKALEQFNDDDHFIIHVDKQGVSASSATPSWFWSIDDKPG